MAGYGGFVAAAPPYGGFVAAAFIVAKESVSFQSQSRFTALFRDD
ncbi:hypothetical protein [Sphingomonas sp.]